MPVKFSRPSGQPFEDCSGGFLFNSQSNTERKKNMKLLSIEQELKGNSYPGRGIIIGKSADGKKAVSA